MSAIKGHPGLYWRGSVIWGQWWCKRCPEHQQRGRHRESMETNRIKDAALELARRKSEPKKPVIDIDQITVNYLLDRFLNRTGIQRSTLCEYEDLCRVHLRPALGYYLATDLIYDGRILENFVKAKQGEPVKRRGNKETGKIGYSPARINAMLNLLSGAYEHLHKELLGMHPEIPKLEDHSTRKEYFGDNDTSSLIKHLPPDIIRPLLVLDHTGWRSWSEVFSRKRYHWNKEKAVLILEPYESKNQEAREFPVNNYLSEILKEQEAVTVALEKKLSKIIPWLFHDPQGNPLCKYYEKRDCWKPTRYLRGYWDPARKATKLVHKRMHDFRRSGIRRYGESGIDDATGMEMSGHKSIRVYHAYKAIGKEDLKKASEKLSVHSHSHNPATISHTKRASKS